MEITLPYNFTPREYQIGIFKALDEGMKKLYFICHRRGGKDATSWNAMIREGIKKKGIYYYVFPTYAQGKKILWDNYEMWDFVPKEIIKAKNASDMKLTLVNGSIIQIVGSEHYDALRGTNPVGIVMSEYAFQHPKAWETLSPILVANGGWVIFNTTPNGKNHAYKVWNIACKSDSWYSSMQTVAQTGVIPDDMLADERERMDKQMFLQEYFCSFDVGAYGAYYTDEMAWVHKNNHVRQVDYDENLFVDTHWDIGINDATAIWFVQNVNGELHIIDHYEVSGKGFDGIVTDIKEKEYRFGTHYMPHDFEHREFMLGESRLEYAKKKGFKCRITPSIPVSEGIDLARRTLKKCFFDAVKCKTGIEALENYHKEYDDKAKVFKKTPKHDWSSNSADAMRYLAINTKQEIAGMFDEKLPELRSRGIIEERKKKQNKKNKLSQAAAAYS